jgi:hypothetical protein
MDRSSLSAQRLVANNDVILELVKHLDESALHPFLLTSKAFAAAAMPRLYRRITVDHSRPSLFRDLSAAPRHPSPESPGAAIAVEEWTKASAWKHVRELSIQLHGESACPGRLYPDTVPVLPNLEHIHLSGGETTLEMGPICSYHSCPLLDRYRTAKLSRLTIRKLDQMPVFPSVSHLTIILRPCQFPFEARGAVTYSAGTFRPLSSLRSIDIVLWDERHQHRIDWVHHPAAAWPPVKSPPAAELRMARGARPVDQSYKTKGCTYCDQTGCIRYSPNAPKQIPGLVYSAVRWTAVGEVRVWNAERSVEDNQWWDSRMTLEECCEAVREAARRGRKERLEDRPGAKEESQGVQGGLKRGGASEEAADGAGGTRADVAEEQRQEKGHEPRRGARVRDEDEDVRSRVDVTFKSGADWVRYAAADLALPDRSADMEYWSHHSA